MLACATRGRRRVRGCAVSSRSAALHRAGSQARHHRSERGGCGGAYPYPGAALKTALLLLALATLAAGQPIRIGVFSLFKPDEIVVMAVDAPLDIESGGLTSRLEGSQFTALRSAATVTSPTGGPAPFILNIRGKI